MEMLTSRYEAVVKPLVPGVLIAGLIALAAQFISDHYGAPSMLMALLFGIALNFLSKEGPCEAGIAFCSKTVLRIGVALLGARISFDMAASLGWGAVGIVLGGVIATIAFGMVVARFFGHGPRFAFLSSGAVAICGASAAIAISAILPRDHRTEERLVFTVVGVTVLSTVAMIVYPILAGLMGMDDRLAGIFLGATIHDVAQVVGAGFSISEQTGDIATVVKLLRVAMLAPVIFVAVLVIRRFHDAGEEDGERPPLIPGFVLVFIALVAVNSLGFLPGPVIEAASEVARWALLSAIAAVGVKTSLGEVIEVGGPAIALIVLQTLFIGAFAAVMLLYVLPVI
ncbi:MAG: putative sulfate exporter family transporter [Pseudomonadota bacterium]